MGGDRTKNKTSQQTQTQYTASPEERQLINFQLQQAQAFDPMQRQLNQNAGDLVNNLLQGRSLPGYLNNLPGGIDENTISGISKQAIADITPQFQKSGILDSGVAAQIAGRTSADIRNQAAQFNLQNLQQLLNLAVGGQAQVQQPILNTTAQLGGSLAGLRTMSQSGSGSQTTVGMNPFLKSFQTTLGQTAGSFGQIWKKG